VVACTLTLLQRSRTRGRGAAHLTRRSVPLFSADGTGLLRSGSTHTPGADPPGCQQSSASSDVDVAVGTMARRVELVAVQVLADRQAELEALAPNLGLMLALGIASRA
jgi:hypothetical protein